MVKQNKNKYIVWEYELNPVKIEATSTQKAASRYVDLYVQKKHMLTDGSNKVKICVACPNMKIKTFTAEINVLEVVAE